MRKVVSIFCEHHKALMAVRGLSQSSQPKYANNEGDHAIKYLSLLKFTSVIK